MPFRVEGGSWRLDLKALQAAVTPRIRALLVVIPDMPSGAVLNRAEWDEIARLWLERDRWQLYDAGAFADAFALTVLVAAPTLLVGAGASLLLRPKSLAVAPTQPSVPLTAPEPAS